MLLEIHDGTVFQGGEAVLSHFHFSVRGTEKIAVVGRNGAGKTTLLQALAGELPVEENPSVPGSGLHFARAVRIEKLDQSAVKDPDRTVGEMLRAFVGDDPDRMLPYRKMLAELGSAPPDEGKRLSDFSGGEQTKLMLAGVLIMQPDILLLDEPTNHLDISAVEWLEQYLRQYPKAVVAVSHDRFFIDQFADEVWEIAGGKLTRYTGNYTAYRAEKTKRLAAQRRAWQAQQAEIARLDDLIRKFKGRPRKASFARSREAILARMEKIPAPERDDAVIHTGEILPLHRGNRTVLTCEHLQIGYDNTALCTIDLRLTRGRKLGVTGPNGSGKSTFLKTAAGILPPVSGICRLGDTVEIGYLDQMTARISSEHTVFDWFHDQFPALTGKEVRAHLAAFLFDGADFGKPVRALSGGEKTRLALAALLERRPNFLILDEPTNNMDIPAKETLESIFRDYQGTILYVSHDRYFLSHVADSLLMFEEDGRISYYPFDYAHYIARKKRIDAGGDVSIARSAEEQRLVEGLRSVPKASHLPPALSTEAARSDWEFDLNRSEQLQAQEQFRIADEQFRRAKEAYAQEQLRSFNPAAEGSNDPPRDSAMTHDPLPDPAYLAQEREHFRDAWTRACLTWYDLWLEHPS